MDGACLHPSTVRVTERLETGGGPGVYAGVVVFSVTVEPCDHLEWQPPHISATNPSRSAGFIDRTREPESSAGTNAAPHTPQGCAFWEGWCFRETVTLAIPPS